VQLLRQLVLELGLSFSSPRFYAIGVHIRVDVRWVVPHESSDFVEGWSLTEASPLSEQCWGAADHLGCVVFIEVVCHIFFL
jgi:hypothetical protein